MQCQDNTPCDKINELKTLADSARQAAFQSMIEASEYGALIQFIKHSFSADTQESILNALFEYTDSLSLSCSFQIRMEGLVSTWSAADTPAPDVELELFEALKHKGRIFDFNQRTIFNASNTSILIKNMPQEPEDYGRKKDVLAVLLECCEARISSLEKQYSLHNISSKLVDATQELNRNLQKNNDYTINIMESLMCDVRVSFDHLALTEEQEDNFTRLVGSTMASLIELHMSGWETSDKFSAIVELTQKSLSESSSHSSPDSDNSPNSGKH